MDEASVAAYITGSFPDVGTVEKDGATFFFYGPERMFPFATLVTRDDAYDNLSNLQRLGIYRLNLGITRETFGQLFGQDVGEFDYQALGTLFPHPLYGKAMWVSILNPSESTFRDKVAPLVAEAYANDVRKKQRKAAGGPDEGW